MTVQLEVWGPYALFTRPEMKVERVSYDVMTPSAARGILEAVFWHPGMVWRIDRIVVMNPIRFTSVRRNEVSSVISADTIRSMINDPSKDSAIYASSDIQQRASTILRDVHYVIEAHFDILAQASISENGGMSLPSRERGLKFGGTRHHPSRHRVAPFTVAWIEMSRKWCDCHAPGSLPSWERGLKVGTQAYVGKPELSFPLCERGLGIPLRMVLYLW